MFEGTERPVGLGSMRLSTERARDEAAAIELMRAALDAGVTLLDTADAYALDDSERGHNERLIARALAGRVARPWVVTKGGLRRPSGRWQPDGRATWLREACAASREALGVESIDLYLLHAPDPKTSLATSVRALAALRADGWVQRVGLSNVTVAQLEEARRIVPIAAVEVELGLGQVGAIRGGVVEHCAENGIWVLAHRPFGGVARAKRWEKQVVLRTIAEQLEVTAHQVVLAYLRSLSPWIVPLPGPTTVEHAVACAHVPQLDASACAELDVAFEVHALLRTPRVMRRPKPRGDGAEVVLIMGAQGSGKSTAARAWVEEGYARANRDEVGGTLTQLHRAVAKRIAAGEERVVLDNTYAHRAVRNEVIEVAWRAGLPARCVFLNASLDDALYNSAWRMVEKYGDLVPPEELTRLGKTDPAVFGPDVPSRWFRDLEPPTEDEGWSKLEVLPFERARPEGFEARGILLAIDGTLRTSASGARTPQSAADVRIDPARAAHLAKLADEGFIIGAVAWVPERAAGTMREATFAEIEAETNARLGFDLDLAVCPHAAGPARCWCRLPLPGLGARFVYRHRLRADRSIMIGASPADRTFARRIGFQFVAADAFFKA